VQHEGEPYACIVRIQSLGSRNASRPSRSPDSNVAMGRLPSLGCVNCHDDALTMESARMAVERVAIGRGTFVGQLVFSTESPDGPMRVGADVAVLPRCPRIAATREIGRLGCNSGWRRPVGSTIDDGNWRGARSATLSDVNKRTGVVVPAGAGVVDDILNGVLVADVAACIMRELSVDTYVVSTPGGAGRSENRDEIDPGGAKLTMRFWEPKLSEVLARRWP